MSFNLFFKPKSYTISLIVFAIIFSGVLINVVGEHESLTKTLTPASNTIEYRDISNTAISTITVSTDKSNYLPGDTVTITVTDDDANFDPFGDDGLARVILASMTSTTSGSVAATAILTETGGLNSATFSGTIILSSSSITSGNVLQTSIGDQISVSYDPNRHIPSSSSTTAGATGFARFFANFSGISGSIDVKLNDYPINSTSRAFPSVCPYDMVLHPVNMTLSGSTTGINVTLSFANAIMGLYSPTDLEVIWRPVPGAVFQSLGANLDNTAKTVTNTIQPTDPDINGDSEAGQYSLGVNIFCGGGGGGGLVRPGLVVNALAGIGGAGGGGGLPGPTIALGAVALSDSGSEIISLPQEIRDFINDDFDPHTPLEPITDIYDDFDLPLSINGNGFALAKYENTLVPQTVKPGEPIEFKLVFYTNSGVAFTSLNFNLGPTRTIAGSDTQVLLYKDKPVEIIDPNGNIATATGSINNEGDLKRVATFSITFSDSVKWPTSDFVIRSWTNELNSGDIIVYDAISVTSSEIVEIADEDIPEPEIQTLKSQYVPIWIKNNAAWWSQQLIEDSDFVAGIEYLIQNEIITIQDNQVIASSYSSNEIPEWIKNNAGWWSEDLITEKEFIDGLQWLISNGIIQVTET